MAAAAKEPKEPKAATVAARSIVFMEDPLRDVGVLYPTGPSRGDASAR
jgi:hypothetical protein